MFIKLHKKSDPTTDYLIRAEYISYLRRAEDVDDGLLVSGTVVTLMSRDTLTVTESVEEVEAMVLEACGGLDIEIDDDDADVEPTT